MNQFYKNLSLWLVIILMMVMLFNMFNKQNLSETNISYTEFLSMVDEERVADVLIQGQELIIKDVNGARYKIYAPQDNDLIRTLRDRGVTIEAKPPDETPWFISILASWF